MLIKPRSSILRPRVRCAKRAFIAGLWFLGICGLVAAGWAQVSKGQGSDSARDRHVVVISVDGMGASLLLRLLPKANAPNLRRLRHEGSFAEGVVGIFPTVTYPSHTTIITGRLPAEHGIYTNVSSREAGKNSKDWFWFAKALKAPTLWDEAREHHLTTATVFWPVSAGAPVEWDVPEIWDPQKGEAGDPLYVAKFATPGLLFQALLEIGPPGKGANEDISRERLAAFVLKKYKPNLLLFHLASLDGSEHSHGPSSSEAQSTFELEDKLIGDLLNTIREVGQENSTNVFVVSDHGFQIVENKASPNVLLAKAGFVTTDEHGAITGGKVMTVSNGGSFFIYWPEDQDLRSQVEEALKPLRERGAVREEFGRRRLQEFGAEPAIQLALDAADGWEFTSSAAGEVFTALTSPIGTHGYSPARPELQSSFIAWGPDIKAGVNLHQIAMTRIGPTILQAMGIKDSKFGTQPALGEIFKEK